MKKTVLILFMTIASIQCFSQLGYRYGDSFIKLTPDTFCYFIQTTTKQQMDNLKKQLSNMDRKDDVIADLSENSCIMLSKPKSTNSYISEIFKDGNGLKIIILPRLAIKMKNNHDISEVIKSFESILVLDKEEDYLYKIDCKLKNAREVLEINTRINEMDCVDWCEPMMIGEAISYNFLYPHQYYLQNTGQSGGTPGIDINVNPIWDLVSVDTTLVVAVLDDGVERNHEDLSGSVLDGMTIDYPNEKGDPIGEYNNYTYYDPLTQSYKTGSDTKTHGTACAGIIAAHNNEIGIRGVASGVKILPININPYLYPLALLPYPTLWYEKIGLAITWSYNTMGADIISCSWGFSDNTYISNALTNAKTYGRNGKGTIVVCASGNAIPYSDVKFPANMSGTIATGSINKNGVVWDYSCRGSSLDIVAPSGNVNNLGDVYTTDRSAPKGVNMISNYMFAFGGTSAACPQVAGVAALMLSANPNLTQSQVKHILQCTAKKLPNMYGQNRTDAYGYGLVDAYAAVKVAQYWQNCGNCTLSGSSTVCSNETYSISGVPSNATVSWRFEGQTSSSPTIVPNSSNYTCSVSPGYSSFKGYLCADVKIQGYTIATYDKLIEGGNGFIGYYWDDTVYMDVLWSDDNWVTPGHVISVHSEDLAGKTAKISRSSAPSNYTNLSILGTSPETRVEFYMPYLSSGEYLTLWITGICGVNSFVFYATSNRNCSNPLSVSEQGEHRYLLSLNRQNDENIEGEGNAICNSNDDYWVFRVYNATNLQQVASELVKGNQFLLDASTWKAGIYIIRAYIDEKPYTVKISVK